MVVLVKYADLQKMVIAINLGCLTIVSSACHEKKDDDDDDDDDDDANLLELLKGGNSTYFFSHFLLHSPWSLLYIFMLSQSLQLALFPFESQHPGDAFLLLQSLF